jgi:hypothetical protein
MPTLRLGDSERGNIIRAFTRVLERAKNNKKFPLIEDDFPEFGYSLLEPEIAAKYEYLHLNAPKLVRSSAWNPNFKLRTDDFEYEIGIYEQSLPQDALVISRSHERYDELLDWAETYAEAQTNIHRGSAVIREVVEASSSIGQVKRVLSEEILRFIPDHMQATFADAERRSRFPSNLPTDGLPDRLENLANTLALGSLSPESVEGIRAATIIKKPIDNP